MLMENRVNAGVSFFLGANTPGGFFSLFDELYMPKDGWKLYIIKGGPGTGKSTLMKKIAAEAERRGHYCERIFCSSDPASLDGVIIPALKVSVADGTPPHVLEPKYPGVSERIVDLGRFRSDARLQEHAAEIIRLTDENKEMHAMCARYLNAAGAAGQDLMQIVSDALDTEKAESFVRHLAGREFGAGAGGKGTVQRRFLSAVTPVGIHTFYETADALCERRIVLHDELGLPSAVITAALCAMALENGCRVIQCLCPLAPERKIDHLILPELRLGVFTSNERHPFPRENAKNVQCVRFLTKNETRLHKNRIRFTRRAQGEMLAEALRYQQKAKALHDALEQYYIDAMDFDSLAEYTERLIKNVLE